MRESTSIHSVGQFAGIPSAPALPQFGELLKPSKYITDVAFCDEDLLHLPDWQNHLLRVVLLACQSGKWVSSGSGSDSQIVMPLHFRGSNPLTFPCPAEWIDLAFESYSISGSSVFNGIHSCLSPANKACSAIEIWGGTGTCPVGWSLAASDKRAIHQESSNISEVRVTSCYRCM